MHPLLRWAIAVSLVGGAVFWFVTRPEHVDPAQLAGMTGDVTRGEAVFNAGGCASCHAPETAESDVETAPDGHPSLIGGRAFPSAFGTFYAPNITPDPEQGIGGWSLANLADAMHHGTSPQGQHYFPAFPYTTYQNATMQDIADLHAFLMTLPADATLSKPHDVGFPFNIRRSLGGWKLLFGGDGWVLKDAPTPQLERGRYLVEALGHCGECHTPRNPLGGLMRSNWLAGAPNPTGKGRIPNITPGVLDWSESDIVEYLTSGFTPEFDTAGGEMAEVVQNMAKLPESDRAAIAAYLKAVPARP